MDAADFRRLMGFWATGVSVITAQGADGPAGVTANVAQLAFALPAARARLLRPELAHADAVRESERFCINMLSAGQEEVSRLFATKRSHEEKFARISHQLEHGVPVIGGALAWLVCDLESEFRRGDHVVAIGVVRSGASEPEAEPLLFYRGAYLSLPHDG